MALTADKFIIPNGAPAAGLQTMQSSSLGPADVVEKGFIGLNPVIVARSEVNQQPATENVPINVTFGAAQGTPADPVQLLADGTIVINEAGAYALDYNCTFGRLGNNGTVGVSLRVLSDGVQVGDSIAVRLFNNSVDIPYSLTVFFEGTVGEEIVFEIVRDTTGLNEGGLIANSVSTPGWNTGFSASLRMWQLRNHS